MSDTAEYWWKDPKAYAGPKFIHLKELECGHFHVASSKKIIDVDCHACLRIIKDTPELNARLEQSIKSREDFRFRFGKCDCGKPMCERKNKKTGEKFLGCSNYPHCKNTKSI